MPVHVDTPHTPTIFTNHSDVDHQRRMLILKRPCTRGGGGKFITAYPRDDEHFRLLAEQLDRVTRDLAGPTILSDKALRRGSLVHYRYGGFSLEPTFTDDGVFESRMVGPDGTAVADERRAWFSPPDWAPSPFADQTVAADIAPTSMLLGGRFRVHTAIRHANKGGVYRAVDERDGADVIVKQARAHIGAGLDGMDARDFLRAEARMLDVLAPLAVAPGTIALFDEQGDVFLAAELIPGRPLHQWAADRARDGGLDVADAAAMARRLVALAQSVHDAGLVICDLKPHNVMVTPFDEIRLIDVEFVAPRGDESAKAGFTAGYAAPERGTVAVRPVPEPQWDWFSLGATLFHMLTALNPKWVSSWVPGQEGARRSDADAKGILLRIGGDHPVLLDFTDVIVGLTQPDPGRRWSLAQADEFLDTKERTVSSPVKGHVDTGGLVPSTLLDSLLAEGSGVFITLDDSTRARAVAPGPAQAFDACH